MCKNQYNDIIMWVFLNIALRYSFLEYSSFTETKNEDMSTKLDSDNFC